MARVYQVGLVILGVGVLLSCGLLLPCVYTVSDRDMPRMMAINHLTQVGDALLAYHDAHKRLPPAVVRRADGTPLYSWRVAVLPYLGETALYDQFHRDEPWDSPHNATLLGRMPSIFAVQFDDQVAPTATPFQVLVGPGTAFERPGLNLGRDFPDGPDTVLVVEAAEAVPWTKPADLAYDPAGPLPAFGGRFRRPVDFLCYEVGRTPGFHAVLTGGRRWTFVPSDTDDRTVRALITRDGDDQGQIDRSKVQ